MKKTMILVGIILLIGLAVMLQKTYTGNATSVNSGITKNTNTVSSGSPVTMSAIAPSGVKNPACTDNYQTWSSSTVYNQNANWSVGYMRYLPGTTGVIFQDINGDGLPDYIYHNKGSAYVNQSSSCGSFYDGEETCVYLSNGHGWSMAYKCYAKCEQTGAYPYVYVMKYYGDCAG